jgi:hypothetical protein
MAAQGYIQGSGATTSSVSTITLDGTETLAKVMPDEAVLESLEVTWDGDPGAIAMWLARDAAGAFPITRLVAPTADLHDSQYAWVCGLRAWHVQTANSAAAKGTLYLHISTANSVTTDAALTWSS